jgi:UDP:flavonoid glycosyltransferase YjiC (YdhE family)
MGHASKHRILFIGEVVTLSHMARPLFLAARLDPERYEVHLAFDERYLPLAGAEAGGHRLIKLRSRITPEKQEAARLGGGPPLFDAETLDRYVQEDLRLMAEIRPDVVVGDMRQSLVVSSRVAGVPFVNIINAHWSPWSATPVTLPTEYPGTYWVGPGWAQFAWTAFLPLSNALTVLPHNQVRMKYGLPPLGLDLKTVYSYGDYTVFPDIPELNPVHHLPPSHRYIGPVVWSPRIARPPWWDAVPTDRPAVYVGLGTSGNPGLLRSVVEALAELPVSLLVATAGSGDAGPERDNVFVADYLPGSEAARRARLTVCNGGSMPVQQSLAVGTPVLGLTSNIDQAMFMGGVAAAGAGAELAERDLSVPALRARAAQLLADDECLASARRMRDEMERVLAANAFSGLIGEIVGGARAEREPLAS